jgi:NAD(P)-dependent dehydrogenase (short-subunit alcohol dehydrogenase family)
VAVEKLVDHWGPLDVVFANAGVNGLWAPIDRLTVDEWRKTIDINLNGTFYTLKFTVPHLKKRGGVNPLIRDEGIGDMTVDEDEFRRG